MFSNFMIYLQRIGVAFGLSLALVGAVAAQTTAPITDTAATDTGGADLTDAPQIADPTSGGYGFRIGLYNVGTTVGGIFRGGDWREDRHLALNGDYVRQCNKAKDKEDVLARVLDRKERHDAFLEQIAETDPTFKDEVAREFAVQRGALLGIKNATGGASATRIDKAIDDVATTEARFTGKRGLPADAEAQLKALGIPDDKIAQIKAAADQDWASGYRAFKNLMAENPDLARVMEAGFHKADFQTHGARIFGPGGPPQDAFKYFDQADQIARLGFLSDADLVGKHGDFIGEISRGINPNNFRQHQGDLAKVLSPDLVKRFGEFNTEYEAALKQSGGDHNKVPQSFYDEFERSHGYTKLPQYPGGPGYPTGDYKGGPYPEPKSGQHGSYQPGGYQQGSYPPPSGGTTGGTTQTQQYQQGDQHTGSYSYTVPPSPTATSTTPASSPSPTYTSPPTATATATYTSPTPTSTFHSCPTGQTWSEAQHKCI